ncbi:MAG: 6-bladed beta-propeller, partial [Gemmatimonadota bacterium]|nr:6-bladed beta-propeller [Gemmatimonadota bacterium]
TEIRLVERAVLGGFEAEGPDAFGKVNSVAVLPGEDAIAVADGTVQEILLFGLDGQLIGRTGGRGGGPGEFRAVRQMSVSRDGRLEVWDVQQSRVTTFDASLELEGAHRADLEPVQAMFPEFVGFFADGGFVLRDGRSEIGMRDLPEGIRQDTVRLYAYSSTGRFEDTLAVLVDEPKWFRNRDGGWGREELIFGRELTSVVVGDEVWVGSTGTWTFTRYGAEGVVLGDVDLGVRPRPASPEEIQDERARRIDAVRVRDVRAVAIGAPVDLQDVVVRMAEAERNAIREVASNDTLPAYDLVVAGTDGPVLVREYPRPLDISVRWVVIDGAGLPLGRLTLPRDTEIKAVAPGMLVVLERDAFDAPLARILEMRGGAGTGS